MVLSCQFVVICSGGHRKPVPSPSRVGCDLRSFDLAGCVTNGRCGWDYPLGGCLQRKLWRGCWWPPSSAPPMEADPPSRALLRALSS